MIGVVGLFPMRTHLVRLYLLSTDLVRLDRLLAEKWALAFFATPLFADDDLRRSRLSRQAGFGPSVRLYLVRPGDVPNLVFRPPLVSVPTAIDLVRSPAIEFCRPVVDGRTLLTGQMFFIAEYREPFGQQITKSDDFIRWGEGLFQAVRRMCRRLPGGAYAGPDALRSLTRRELELERQ